MDSVPRHKLINELIGSQVCLGIEHPSGVVVAGDDAHAEVQPTCLEDLEDGLVARPRPARLPSTDGGPRDA